MIYIPFFTHCGERKQVEGGKEGLEGIPAGRVRHVGKGHVLILRVVEHHEMMGGFKRRQVTMLSAAKGMFELACSGLMAFRLAARMVEVSVVIAPSSSSSASFRPVDGRWD